MLFSTLSWGYWLFCVFSWVRFYLVLLQHWIDWSCSSSMRRLEGQCKYSCIMFWILQMEEILLQLIYFAWNPNRTRRFSIWNCAGFLPSRVCCPKMGTPIRCFPDFSLATSFIRSGPCPQFLIFRLFGGHFPRVLPPLPTFVLQLVFPGRLEKSWKRFVYHVYLFYSWHSTLYY